MNRLMQGAKRAALTGVGRVHEAVERFFDETTNETLQARVKLRDTILEEASRDGFKAFHADAVMDIRNDTRELLSMSVKDFSGNVGVELRGKILGAEGVFERIASIIKEGNSAETMLEKRKAVRTTGEPHTNFSS